MSSSDKGTYDEHRVERVGTSASAKSSENDISNNKHDTTAAQQLAAQWVEGTIEEKRLVRKLDWRILPCTWILYLLGFLDRANIG
jgi:hypothetical protein